MIYRILIIFILSTTFFLSALLSFTNAQIVPQDNGENSANSQPAAKNPYGIRITSPSNGEQVFINGSDYFDSTGAKLTIEGFSVSDNGNLTNCKVSIITNSIFPYQAANGSGPLGINDYSKWTYHFGPSYANLHEGSNKITSKLTCDSGIAKAHYSVNVTGTKFNGTFPASSTSLELSTNVKSNTSKVMPNSNLDLPVTNIKIFSPSNGAIIDTDKPVSINGSSEYPSNYNCEVLLASGTPTGVIAPASANNSNFKKTTATGNNGTNDYRNWNIILDPESKSIKNGSQSLTAKLQCYTPLSSVKFAKVNIIGNSPTPIELKSMSVSIDKIGVNTNQRIIIGVNDVITNEPLVGAKITGSINDGPFTGTTDTNGKYTVTIPKDVLDSASSIDVSVTASADGYKIKNTNTTFEGPSKLPDDSTSVGREDKTNEEELANKIFDDVQKQLSEQGINIPLPFG